MKRKENFFWELVKTVALAALVVIPIRVFIFQPFLVRGSSMEPNFHRGDYLIVDQVSYRFKDPERGDVIVFHDPQGSGRRYIKRVIGLPGETIIIADGIIEIYKDEVTKELENEYLDIETPGDIEEVLGDGEYFVLGDNRAASLDSRNWGVLPEREIIGKVSISLSPHSIIAGN